MPYLFSLLFLIWFLPVATTILESLPSFNLAICYVRLVFFCCNLFNSLCFDLMICVSFFNCWLPSMTLLLLDSLFYLAFSLLTSLSFLIYVSFLLIYSALALIYFCIFSIKLILNCKSFSTLIYNFYCSWIFFSFWVLIYNRFWTSFCKLFLWFSKSYVWNFNYFCSIGDTGDFWFLY